MTSNPITIVLILIGGLFAVGVIVMIIGACLGKGWQRSADTEHLRRERDDSGLGGVGAVGFMGHSGSARDRDGDGVPDRSDPYPDTLNSGHSHPVSHGWGGSGGDSDGGGGGGDGGGGDGGGGGD